MERFKLRIISRTDKRVVTCPFPIMYGFHQRQVLDHQESRKRQYTLPGHAVALAWPKERVLVIDEDQGQSGKTAENRLGFHRLLAEVMMDRVGLVQVLQ